MNERWFKLGLLKAPRMSLFRRTPLQPDQASLKDFTNRIGRKRWGRWWVLSLVTVLASVLSLSCVLTAHRPYRPTAPLPAARLIDLHAHTAGIGAGGSGCRISKDLENSWKFSTYLKAFGATRQTLSQNGDAWLVGQIAAQVAQSTSIHQAVVLAMDGVVDEHGQLDLGSTEVYVPN